MVTKNDHHSKVDCLFSNSHHFCLEDLEGSVWMEAAQGNTVFRVADLSKKEKLIRAESEAVTAGIRSMLLSPLLYLEQITPLFAVSLKRGQDELGKHVQTVIKEQCTAVHPSVEWRFKRAALAHLDALRQGKRSTRMADIVFKLRAVRYQRFVPGKEPGDPAGPEPAAGPCQGDHVNSCEKKALAPVAGVCLPHR